MKTEISFGAATAGKAACVLVIALILASVAYAAVTVAAQYGSIGV